MIKQHFNTRVICPYSLATYDKELLNKLLGSKVDCLRFNMQVTQEKELKNILEDLKERAKSQQLPLNILDLFPSARARLDHQQKAVDLKFGETVFFSNVKKEQHFLFNSFCADSFFIAGERVFLGYGEAILETKNITTDKQNVSVECKVLQAGTISGGMALHVPGSRPNYATTNDHFGIGKSFDEVVQFAEDHFQAFILPSYFSPNKIKELRSAFFEKGHPCPWLIQKIDTALSLDRMKDCVSKVDGFLVSRRELSLSVDPATVPMLTKEIFQFCSQYAKLVFTASEILGSMSFKSSPTRAEVSDLANAVLDGTDGIVISEEIPMDERRINALSIARKVIFDVEQDQKQYTTDWQTQAPTIHDEMDAIAIGSLRTARRVGAKAIVCITHSGNTALKLASFKSKLPILAVTFNQDIAKKLQLIRGIHSILLDTPPKIDSILESIDTVISKVGILQKGDSYVFVSVTLSSIGKNNSNLFSVQTLNG